MLKALITITLHNGKTLSIPVKMVQENDLDNDFVDILKILEKNTYLTLRDFDKRSYNVIRVDAINAITLEKQ